MSDFVIKRKDRLPVLTAAFTDAVGMPIDLTNATVNFIMANTQGKALVNAPCVITDAVNGKVEYRWQDGDTAEAGEHYAEFEIDFSGMKLTIPYDGYLKIRVLEDLN